MSADGARVAAVSFPAAAAGHPGQRRHGPRRRHPLSVSASHQNSISERTDDAYELLALRDQVRGCHAIASHRLRSLACWPAWWTDGWASTRPRTGAVWARSAAVPTSLRTASSMSARHVDGGSTDTRQFFDRDKDGAIGFEDFARGMSVFTKGTQDEKIAGAAIPLQHRCLNTFASAVFAGYDLEGTGLLTRESFRLVLEVAVHASGHSSLRAGVHQAEHAADWRHRPCAGPGHGASHGPPRRC